MHSLVYAFDEDLDGTWVLLWHALWHAQPVQPISVHVSLALSPLGFSCVSMCGPWCILAHSDAFVCINVHSCAFLRIMKRVDRAPALIQIVRKSGIFPPK